MALDDIIRNNRTPMKQTRPSYETTVALYDQHAPHIGTAVSKIAKQYITDTKPKRVLLGGDLIDNPHMSTYPVSSKERMDTRDEIDYAVNWLIDLLEGSPKTEVVVLPGNHDVGRFENLKSTRSMALQNLRGMDFFSQLKEAAKDLGLKNTLYCVDKYELGPGMIFLHGDPKMTPEVVGGVNGIKRTADSSAFPGKHIVIGHGHTGAEETSKWGDRTVYKVRAMLDLNHKSYVHQTQYQNGFMVVHYNSKVRPKPTYHVQNIHVQDNTAIIDGTEYNAGRKHR